MTAKSEAKIYMIATALTVVTIIIFAALLGEIKSHIYSLTAESLEKPKVLLDNGFALVDAINLSEEEISEQLLQNKADAENILKENGLPVIQDFTPEEEAAIMSGHISEEEAEQILSRKNSETDFFVNKVSETDDTSAEETADDTVGKIVTKLYSLKAYYMGLLGNMLSQAQQEYSATKANGSQNANALMNKYLSQAGALEDECDAKVYAVLAELESELSKRGADTSVVSSIEEAYIKEKRLKKSYYLTNYMD